MFVLFIMNKLRIQIPFNPIDVVTTKRECENTAVCIHVCVLVSDANVSMRWPKAAEMILFHSFARSLVSSFVRSFAWAWTMRKFKMVNKYQQIYMNLIGRTACSHHQQRTKSKSSEKWEWILSKTKINKLAYFLFLLHMICIETVRITVESKIGMNSLRRNTRTHTHMATCVYI